MSGWKITAMVAAFVAAIGLLLWFLPVRGFWPQETGIGLMRLSRTVADGFVYRSPKEPFPRATFDAFRIGKIKAGVISLAPFSTVEFDNLVLNIPPSADGPLCPAPDSAVPIASAPQTDGGGGSDALGIRSLSAMAYGKPIGRIGGIRINGLSIGRMDGKELKPVLSARRLKNSGRKIVVEGLVLYDMSGERQVENAELVSKPEPAIVWQGGRFELAELSSIFSL